MEHAIEVRRFEEPDQNLDMGDAGGIRIVAMNSTGATGMHAVFEPGWTWIKDEKPLLGNPESCPMHHTGYCMAGTLVVEMVESGQETVITPGDFFEIPAGHHAHVQGGEKVELVLFAAPESEDRAIA